MIRYVPICIVLTVMPGCTREPEEKTRLEKPLAKAEKALDRETEVAVRTVLAENFKVNPRDIDLDKALSAPPFGADELDLVEIVMELEEHFRVEIPDSLIEKYGGGKFGDKSLNLTPRNLINLVEESKLRGVARKR